MLYYVQRGDSLNSIARKFNTSLHTILNANVICNPNLIFVGQPLLIPESNVSLPKAGALPYYILLPGDTLNCLSGQYNIPIQTLVEANQIQDPNLIYAGDELLIVPSIADPEELFQTWKRIGDTNCDLITPAEQYGVFYQGSFQWQALGQKYVPYPIDLLRHPCETVRLYAAMSLGRLAYGQRAKEELRHVARNDPSNTVAELAALALRRIELVEVQGNRIHVMTSQNHLLSKPNLDSTITNISQGIRVIVLRWNIPSPTREEGPRGSLQLYDQVMIVNTGQVGFMPRLGFNEITFI